MDSIDSNKNRIAIVGFDCRLPGADNVDEFWKNLLAEKDSIVEFTEEQLLAAGVSPATFNNPNYVRKRGIVERPDQFDAEFFNFTPKEAELLDPQHRIFLECAWHALEDSGVDPFKTDRKISVYGGTGSPYHFVDTINNKNVQKYANGTVIVTSNDKDYLTTRVSYKLNLTGPSINMQSACSTAMVSVVLGMDSLLNYQTDLLLAGGATLDIAPHQGYLYQQGGLESPDGKCRTFDKGANGTTFSRGCGVVALKRLEDALEDKDFIYAVILSGSINNDGNRKAGYSAPSVDGQIEVITESIELAGIDASSISMVEAHGTATSVGDPIEVASLSEAFRQYTDNKGYCAIGSVKTNIGHTDVASGMASLIKTALSLKNGVMPASLHFDEPNPAINFEDSPFYVNTTTKKLEKHGEMPARALVNSFGVGGTNACVILEEAPQAETSEVAFEYDLLFISAHHKNSFRNYCDDIKKWLEEDPEINLNAFAHTSRTNRKSLKYKGVISFKDRTELLSRLEEEISPLTTASTADRELVWMFPGQGNQFIDMGRELYQHDTIFRETIDFCAVTLKPMLGLDIREVMYPDEKNRVEAAVLLDRTYITQPAIFMVSFALARVFKKEGLLPDALVGHSVGEYVAATLSGIMSLEDAVKSVAFRGKLVYDLPKGSMLAVLLSESELKKVLPEELDIAVINSPELVVVSGQTPDIEAFAAILQKENIFSKQLSTSHAFHSRMMISSLESYREFFKDIVLHKPTIPIISTVTGKKLSDAEAQDHEYWVQHLVEPVLFSAATASKLGEPSVVFLECGPGKSLGSAVKRQLQQGMPHAVVGFLYEGEDSVNALNTAFGKLWIESVVIDYERRFDSSLYHKVRYPLLPFNRKSYRLDLSENKLASEVENVKKENVEEWFYIPSWKRTAAINLVPANELEPNKLPLKWLVFSSDTASDEIAENIRAKGSDCTVIRPAEQYQEEDGTIHIRIGKKDDYQKMINSLSQEECQLHIIHAWNFSSSETEELISLDNSAACMDRGFYSLLYLEQALIASSFIGAVSLSCLVNDAFSVSGKTGVRPEKSLTLGPIRVLFKEHTEMRTKLINLETSETDTFEKFIDKLIQETEIETDETIITYSGTERWTEIIEPVSLNASSPSGIELLKENGVYLVTGGSGGISKTLSRMIAQKVKSSLVWTGRKELPARSEWQTLIESNDTEPNLKDTLNTILQVEQLGSTVHYYSIDVTDFTAMEKMVLTVEAEIGTIDGIIHSAGTAGGAVVALQEKLEAEKVLAPKVVGALVLQKLFQNHLLDFVYLFSSVTSIFGEIGRLDYTSGNAFLDALSHTDFFHAKTVCSVNWGQWGMIGMAADWKRGKNKRIAAGHHPEEKALAVSELSMPVELEFLLGTGDEEYYSVKVNVEDHWVLNEHLVSGMPTLVGTAFVDILTKWYEAKGYKGKMLLSDAGFYAPMIVMNNVLPDLQLVCEQIEPDTYRFLFRSRTGQTEDSWKDNFSGIVSGNNDEKDQDSIDIASLISGFPNPPVPDHHFMTVLDKNKNVMLQYSKRWDCRENIYVGDNEWLTRVELPEALVQDFESYQIHPAMLDVATSAHFAHMADIQSVFLPYAYGKVQVYKPFVRALYSHARLARPFTTGDKYIYFDFMLYDESGEVILTINEYSFVNVGEVSVSDNRTHSATVPDNSGARQALFEEDDILPDEGEKAFSLLLNYPELPQAIIYTLDFPLDFKESKISYYRQKLLDKKLKAEKLKNIDDRPDIDTVYEKPENEIEKSIAGVWSSVLGINKLGASDSFIELGGNSLLAIQVIAGIAEEFGVEIEANEFVTHVTIRAQADMILVKILEEHEDSDIEELLDAGEER